MANPAVTYTFSNSTTADATQVNQNFTDIINGLTDGTKSLTIDSLTANGASALKGTVTLGDSSSDDITFTGSLASSIPIKTKNTYDIGSATLGLRAVYFGNGTNTNTVNVIGGVVTSSYTITLPVAAPAAANYIMEFTTGGVASFVTRIKTPTFRKFDTAGTGTYTPTSGTKWIKVRLMGSGGGGGGANGSGTAGGDGGDTYFGGTGIASGGGFGGQPSGGGAGAGGNGGTPNLGVGPDYYIMSLSGGNGGKGQGNTTGTVEAVGGAGGVGMFGGNGPSGSAIVGVSGKVNTGGGGAGAGAIAGNHSGGGGGAGSYLECVFYTLAASYTYGVGTKGSAGGGTTAGGAGGDGYIIVEEYYQ